MERRGLYYDPEVVAALDWLGDTSGDLSAFRARIKTAQNL